jgi:hypothetical protein
LVGGGLQYNADLSVDNFRRGLKVWGCLCACVRACAQGGV